MTTSRWLSPRVVAKRLGVCRKTVYRMIGRGELRSARVLGRYIGIRADDVSALVRARRSRGRSRPV